MCCCLSTLKVKPSCVAECVYIYAIPPGGPRPTLDASRSDCGILQRKNDIVKLEKDI